MASDAQTDAADDIGSMRVDRDHPELRDAVQRVCSDFPAAYWRELDERRGYPTEFVQALTIAGFLGALIPEQYGGSGLPLRAAAVILEEINASGCVASPAHAQMYIMGTVLRHGSAAQKALYLPAIARGELRLQAFGVTEPTSGSDTTQIRTRAVRRGDRYVVNGQKVWTSRALQSDLMLLLVRTTPIEQCAKKTEGISTLLVDLREAVGQRHGDPAGQDAAQPQHHRSLHRQPRGAGREPRRRGRQGVPLHPRRDERRAHPRGAGVHRRRPLAASSVRWHTRSSASCSAVPSGRTRACSFRSRAPTPSSRPRT